MPANNFMEQRQTSMLNNEEDYKGVGIHSQVTKVKLEMEKINRLAPEAKLALREITRHHHRSRSPLGLVERPISVGN